MRHFALQDAKAQFGKIVEQAREAPLVITRNGKIEAVLLSARPRGAGKVVQGKRGATGLYEVLREAPGPLNLPRRRGTFRAVKL